MGQQRIPHSSSVHSPVVSSAAQGGYESLATKKQDGTFELSVLVGGVHCAGCIQKIEGILAREQDVQNARLNFSTQRLSLIWNGDAGRANDYVQAVEALGYSVLPYDPDTKKEEIKAEERFLLLCLGVAGFAMGNVMLLSVGVWSTSAETMGMATRNFMHWISAFIALPTLLFSGRPFFRSALKALSAGHTNMDVPISLALFLAGGMSLYETINHGEHVYFDSAVMLTFFLLIGRYLDFRARKNARSAATDLLGSLGGFAYVVEGKRTRRLPARDIQPNMIVRVAVGEKFPVDGIIQEGDSSVDTALVTGETMPQIIKKNDLVYAGTVNLDAPVIMRVSKAADNTLLADIVRLMEKAGQGQAAYVRLADKAARLYTPVVHSFAALAFLGWWFYGGLPWQEALMIAITVLIITCPCALGLAVPVVQVLASGRLFKKNVLVKSGDALERLARIDTVLLDKTGTLTLGHPELQGTYDPDVLRCAASLAMHSRHPLSQALLNAAGQDDARLEVEGVKEHPGQGMEGFYEGRKLRLGSASWCGVTEDNMESAQLMLWFCDGENPPVPFYFEDPVRDDAAEVITLMKQHNLKPVLLSGDREAVVKNVAEQVNITQRYAGQKPPEKVTVLEAYKDKGHSVLMVGDGLNDAPVLAGADVSMAPGTAIDMAQNAADIVFMGDKLAPVYDTYRVACLTQKLVRQNFKLAALYNLIAVPLALAGFVTPLMAAIAMSGSSLIVIANSFRLKFMS